MAYINGKEILFSPAVNYTDENPILEAEASRAQKELENMKALGVVETMQEDNTVAYRKTVPANALPYAEVKEVGGMTYASRNIFNAMAVNKSNVVVSDNGASITVTGDPSGDYNATNFYFEAGVYCATYSGTGTLCFVPAPAALTEIVSGVPFTITEEMIGCLAFGTNGGTFENLMIVKGNTPADFAPYIEGGMASAAVTEIETVGCNILDLTPALNNNLVDNGDGTYTLKHNAYGDRFSAIFPIVLPHPTEYTEVNCSIEVVGGSVGTDKLELRTFNANGNDLSYFGAGEGGRDCGIKGVSAQIYLSSTTKEGDYITFRNPMIKLGRGYIGYKPYTKRTYRIPDEVQALDGWGMGVNETYHNRILWDVKNGVKQYRQDVKRIVYDGTEAWFTPSAVQGTENAFYQVELPIPPAAGYKHGVVNGYSYVFIGSTSTEQGWTVLASGLRVRPALSVYPTLDAWKTHLSKLHSAGTPLVLVYALAEPIVTDLKDVLLDDNFITVEGGGTVTAVNANGFDVHTAIEYRVKE